MKNSLSAFWTFFIDKFRVTILLLIFVTIAGTIAFNEIPREIEPTIDIPMATVTTVWPGASPSDIEKLVTDKIEKEIKTLDNVEKYTSTSMSNISIVVVEFDVDADKTEMIQKLRDKIKDAERDLPESLPDSPTISEVSVSDVPVIKMIISGDYSWSELKNFAEILEDEFNGVPKVKDVTVTGAPEDEFHLVLNPAKLEANKISVSDVINTIRAHHRDMPLGIVNVDGETIEVSVRSEMKTAGEIMDLPVSSGNNGIIKISDLGEVRREFAKFSVETYFSDDGDKAQPTILINIIKSASKGNVIKIVSNLELKIEELKFRGILPQGIKTNILYNRGDEIKNSLDILTNSGLQTLVLIIIVMFVFVGWREAILAGIVIPLTLLITVIILNSMGETFNGVSLFALVLAIGLLVDNAIVIVEGMSEAINDKKLSPRDAAIYTLETFRWPLIAGTATTVFAFLPMLIFITGISGQFISVIPITVSITLLSALFVSLLILPALARMFFKKIPPKKAPERKNLKKFLNWYGKIISKIIAKKWKVFVTIILSIFIFIGSLSLVITKKVPVEVFPTSDYIYFTADFEFPEGTNLKETKKLMQPLSEKLREFLAPRENGEIWVKNFVFTVGISQEQGRASSGGSNQNQENILGLTINLTPKEEREAKSYEIRPIIQKELEKIIPKHVESNFVDVAKGPPTGAKLEIRLFGDDIVHLEKMTNELKTKIEKLDGPINVRDTTAEKTTQLIWHFDRDKIAKYGLTPAQVLQTLRASVNGVTAISISESDKTIDLKVRIDWVGDKKWRDPESLDLLNQIPIKTPRNFVTLKQIASPTPASQFSKIDHYDGQKVISVLADMKKEVPVSLIQKDLETAIQKLDRRSNERIEVGGDSEEGNKLIKQSLFAMGVAMILILIVLLTEFNSFTQAFTTLILIPLSLTGVFVGFWITKSTITFPTMIGIVALAGIIVNDAIVLIDQINNNLAKKMTWIEANVEACKSRLQPIFLTSITTVVGMIPLSLSDEFWGGLGFAIVYGMILSTILCLLLVPCFLTLGEIIKGRYSKE